MSPKPVPAIIVGVVAASGCHAEGHARYVDSCTIAVTNGSEGDVVLMVRNQFTDWLPIGLGPGQSKDYTGACHEVQARLITRDARSGTPFVQDYTVQGGSRFLVFWNGASAPAHWDLRRIDDR
jgi:hypothetical protein